MYFCNIKQTKTITITFKKHRTMNVEKFSQKTLNGAVVSSSMRLKAIDVIDGENIVTVIDSEGDVDWGNGDWLSWRREGE